MIEGLWWINPRADLPEKWKLFAAWQWPFTPVRRVYKMVTGQILTASQFELEVLKSNPSGTITAAYQVYQREMSRVLGEIINTVEAMRQEIK